MAGRRKKIKGVPISGGIVLGQARVLMPGDFGVPELVIPASRVPEEVDALDRAVEETIAELRQLRESGSQKAGGAVTKIFDAQLLIASDYEFLKRVKKEIRARKRNAGFVYSELVTDSIAPLRKSSDHYMRQMADEIEGVSRRILSHMTGDGQSHRKFPPNTILVAKNVTPGNVLVFRQRKVIGFLVSEGGTDSHMALIARSLLLPVVVTADAWTQVPNGARMILDGTTGEIILNPTDEERSEYQKKRKRVGPALITRIKRLTRIPPVTADGRELTIAANLSLPGPVDDILAERNIPVGLYRTEFLYLAKGDFPDEETQYRCYSDLARRFSKTTVVLRTFDLGYDKVAEGDLWAEEANPALGWRGIRPMLDLTSVFKTQIKAILRASTQRNLRIMLPMITEVAELEKARKLISQCKLDLRREGIDFDPDIPVGIMVEVPAAALTADVLAEKADFMSIGTNDLTQYVMAADRMNTKVADLYSTYHPSVLSLINMTAAACHRHGKPISLCGEVAGDLLALPLFVGMDIQVLSMTANRIFDVCRTLRRIDSRLVRHLVGPVLSSRSQQAVRRKLENYRMELEKRKH